ncbi:MAG: hypothetical protein U9R15_11945 [Chloroflexota bacterium]|nr:hypothetical protein [Chloroflexota bacterium]
MIYKVSYVVMGKPQLGEIVNLDGPPRVGDQVELSDELCEVIEVVDLIPPRGDFAFLHVTCQSAQDES